MKFFTMLCKNCQSFLRFAGGQCFLPSLPKILAGVLGGMFFSLWKDIFVETKELKFLETEKQIVYY